VSVRIRLAGWIDFWSSREATIVPLLLALGAQLPHSAVVFHRVSTTLLGEHLGMGGVLFDWGSAIIAAVAIEVAVLVFVLRGKLKLSWTFALASASMNMIYYWQADWDWQEPTVLMVGATLWAVMLPAAIAFYSHEVGEKDNGEKNTPWWQRLYHFVFRKGDEQVQAQTQQPVIVAPQQKPPKVSVNGHGSANGLANGLTVTQSVTGSVQPEAGSNGNTVTQVDRVAQLDSEGLSTKQIAESLGVTESTVRVYRKKYRDQQG